MPVQDSTFTATIANGQTASGAVDMNTHALCGMFIPSSFTGTTITFQTALTLAGTYVSVRDGAGSALSKTVAQGQYIPLDPADFAGIRFLKIVSGSAEGGERVVTLVGRLL